VTETHLTETELVRYAFADTSVADDKSPRHLAHCTACHETLGMLRVPANMLRVVSAPAVEATPRCLDDESVAAIAEGSIDLASEPPLRAHLLDCPRCRREVAAVARMLDAPDVRQEAEALRRGRRHWRRLAGLVIVGGAVAAALLVVIDRAWTSKVAERSYREESVTGSAAPRLVAPLGGASSLDVLRWTSVPRADRYRIILFARDGSVIWEAVTRDTAVATPDFVRNVPNDTILWRVAAHVGWEDRWTTSELAMLAVPRARR